MKICVFFSSKLYLYDVKFLGLEKLESNQLFTMMNIKNESGLDSHLIQETPEGIEVIADPTTAQIESVTLPEHIDDAELSGEL